MNFENFEYEVKYGLVKILSYSGKEKKVVIPEKINNKNVYTICSHSFLDLKELEEIIIPKSVGCIEDAAICDCNNLKKVVLPIVEDLGNFIKDCSQTILIETKSPRMACKCERMNNDFDIHCDKDFKYTITNEDKKECRIDRIRFRSHRISIPDEIDGYKVTKLGFSLYGNNIKFSFVKLPKYLKAIPDSFFNCQYELDSIEMGDCIESIGTYAFYRTGIKNLEEFVISNKVKSIGKYAFAEAKFKVSFEENSELETGDYALSNIEVDASNLKKIKLAAGVFYRSVVDNLSLKKDNTFIPNSAFRKATLNNLRGFTKIKEIGSYAFAEVKMNKKFDFDLSKITSVGSNAFMYAEVESIHIPKGFKLSEGLFAYCKAKKVTFDEDFDGDCIPSECFRSMSNLKEFEMPSSITKIKNTAFYQTCLLEKIDLKNVEEIGKSAFSYSGIKEAHFGANLKLLEYNCFSENNELTQISFEESSLEYIPGYCFKGCIKLAKVLLSSNIKRILNCAFENDSSLTTINLENIEELESDCFYAATDLKEVILTNIKIIGSNAFGYCKSLEKVIFGNFLESIDDYAFRSCAKISKLDFPDSVKEIGDYSLQGTNIEEFVIPKNIKTINASIFYGMNSVKKIVLNDSITQIPSYCFNNINIEELVLGNNITAIESCAITSCNKLKKLVLPEKVKALRHDCIQYCSSLEEVHILGTLNVLNTGVFKCCKNLRKINTDDFVSAKKLISRYTNDIEEVVPINKTLPKKRVRKAKTA